MAWVITGLLVLVPEHYAFEMGTFCRNQEKIDFFIAVGSTFVSIWFYNACFSIFD